MSKNGVHTKPKRNGQAEHIPNRPPAPPPDPDQALAPDRLREELFRHVQHLRNPRTALDAPLAALRRIDKILAELARRDLRLVLEVGFASVVEVVAILITRLSALVVQQLHEAADPGREHRALELPADVVTRLLPTLDQLANLQMRLSDSYGKLKHLEEIEQREGRRPARAAAAASLDKTNGKNQAVATPAGSSDASGDNGRARLRWAIEHPMSADELARIEAFQKRLAACADDASVQALLAAAQRENDARAARRIEAAAGRRTELPDPAAQPNGKTRRPAQCRDADDLFTIEPLAVG